MTLIPPIPLPSKSNLKPKRWLFLAITGILLIILIGGVILIGIYIRQSKEKKEKGVASTETINTTADWKTYTNDELGISFKYPNDFSEILENNTVVITTSERGEAIELEIIGKPFREENLLLNNDLDLYKKILSIVLDNKKVYTYSYYAGDCSVDVFVLPNRDNSKIINMKFGYCIAADDTSVGIDINMQKNILSTFRFIE